jgi:hypothetical protein
LAAGSLDVGGDGVVGRPQGLVRSGGKVRAVADQGHCGAAATVADVHLVERFGRQCAQLPLARAGVLRIEEPGRMMGRQGEGEVADAGVVGGAGGRW